MASKINKKYSADIKGILDIEDDKLEIEVEDIENPINLVKFFADFPKGKEEDFITYGKKSIIWIK